MSTAGRGLKDCIGLRRARVFSIWGTYFLLSVDFWIGMSYYLVVGSKRETRPLERMERLRW